MNSTTTHKALYAVRAMLAAVLVGFVVTLIAPATHAFAATEWTEGVRTISGTVNGPITINGDVTIEGDGTIQGDGKSSVITIKSGSLTIRGDVEITGGKGDLIKNEEMEPRSNYYFHVGGGIYVEKGTLNLEGGKITNNTAQRGGGIFINNGATLNMSGGTVSNNETVDKYAYDSFAGEGGGIFVWGTANISGGKIINNTCGSKTDLGGGGLYVNNGGTATLINAKVTGNTSEGFGGGIAGCCHGEMSLVATDGVALYGNKAGVDSNGSTTTVKHTEAKKNTTSSWEVAHFVDHSTSGYLKAQGSWIGTDKQGFEAKDTADFFTAGSSLVSNYMTGGGSARYTAKAGDYQTQNTASVETIKDDKVYNYTNTNLGLVANPVPGSEELIPAGVEISGNHSTVNGGGIGCNGSLFFGSEEGQTIKITKLNMGIEASKTLDGQTPNASYTFELLYGAADGNHALIDNDVAQTKASKAKDGAIEFSFDKYSQIEKYLYDKTYGEHGEIKTAKITFYLREVNPNNNAIAYDKSIYKIEATLNNAWETSSTSLPSNTGSNRSIDITYEISNFSVSKVDVTEIQGEYGATENKRIDVTLNNGIISGKNILTFNNKNKVEATLLAKKSITTGYKTDREFTFKLQNSSDGFTPAISETKTTNGAGTAAFSKIEYDREGKYHYTITEVAPNPILAGDNWEYDSSIWDVAVEVSENLGKLDVVGVTYSKQDSDVTNKSWATFTNEIKTGSLTLKKEIAVNPVSPYTDESFEFTVTLAAPAGSNDSYNGKITVNKPNADSELVDFGNGVFNFTLKATETASISGIPAGFTYNVVESDPAAAGYKVYAVNGVEGQDSANGTISANDPQNVLVTNIRNRGALLISKGVTFNNDQDLTGVFGDINDVENNGANIAAYNAYMKAHEEARNEAESQKYNFNVYNEDGDLVAENVVVENGKTNQINDLPTGKYTVKETNGALQNLVLTVTVNGAQVEGGAGENTVVLADVVPFAFTNNYDEQLGSLTIKKRVQGGDVVADQTYHIVVTGDHDYHYEFDLKDNETKKLDNLVPGKYHVREDVEAAKVPGYNLSATVFSETNGFKDVENDVTIELDGMNPYCEVVNTYAANGELVLSKLVTDPDNAQTNRVFQFLVTGPSYSPESGGKLVTIDASETGEAFYTLPDAKDREQGFTGLLPGEYTVSELIVDGTEVPGHHHTVTVTGNEQAQHVFKDTDMVSGSTSVSGTVGKTFVIGNTYEKYGSLEVKKTLSGNNTDPNADWHFRVELSDATISGVFGEMTFTNGVAEFTLKGGQTATATELPPNVEYTVTEAEANQGGYTTTSTGAEGEILPGSVASVEFVNSRSYNPYGSLTLRKSVEAPDMNLVPESFHFTVTGPNGYSRDVDLAAGESITLNNLTPGSYTVVEDEDAAQVEGWDLSATFDIDVNRVDSDGNAIVSRGSNTLVDVTNTYTTTPLSGRGAVTINKKINGGGDEAQNKVYTFDVYNAATGELATTVTITGEGSANFSLLPGEYRIVERDASIAGLVWNMSVKDGGKFSVVAGESVAIDVTNDYTTTTTTPTDEEIEIPNTPVPLASRTPSSGNNGGGSDDTVELFDEDVPLGYLPKTGDATNLMLIASIAVIAGAALALGAKLLAKGNDER